MSDEGRIRLLWCGLYLLFPVTSGCTGDTGPSAPPELQAVVSADAPPQPASQTLPLLARLPDVALGSDGFRTSSLLGRASILRFGGDSSEAWSKFQSAAAQAFPSLVQFVTIREIGREQPASGESSQSPLSLTVVATAEQIEQLKPQLGTSSAELDSGHVAILVDPQGDIRGCYDLSSAAQLKELQLAVEIALDEFVVLKHQFINPAWLSERREAQLATRDSLRPFHDFSFVDRVLESGITFRHRIVDDAGRMLITAHYDHGNGVASADVDGDGLQDLLFVNQVGTSQLWKNLGDGQFQDITDEAGIILDNRIGVSASFADIDNDGDADLYLTTVRGGNALFENDGAGNFQDVSEDSGIAYIGHSSSARFFDYDRDGWLDLFLVNVGHYTTETVQVVTSDRYTGDDTKEYTYHVSTPDAFAAHLKPDRAERSLLFRNLGDGKFEDVTDAMGLVDRSWSGDATPLDANHDGWPDLYVLNMQGHDEYYENQKGQGFKKRSRELFPATPWGSMGVKSFDFDNDGLLDLYVTDMHTDMALDLAPADEKQKIPADAMDPNLLATDGNHVWGNALFRQHEDQTFSEMSDELNAENYWPWGLSAGDLNADGFQDLFVTASMNFPFRYAVNSLLLNDSGQAFVDAEFILGAEPRRQGRTAIPWFELDLQGDSQNHPVATLLRSKGIYVSRSVVWGAVGSRASVILDIENDGDLDVVTNDFNSVPMLLVSDLAARKQNLNYLQVKLRGTASNRDGLGAEVIVRADGREWIQVHDGVSGYLSQSSAPLYFGLDDQNRVDQIEVRWPSGTKQLISGPLETNRLLTLEETSTAQE